jgi:predicted flap endonuclease-1-like 5' DNA nuclease
MKKVLLLSGVLLVLLLLVASLTPVAFAQGTTGDRVVMGESYVLQGEQTLEGNLTVLGGSADIQTGATVDGDASVLGGSLILGGTVTGNVTVLGGSVQLSETAVVYGNVANLAGSVQREPGAVVHGETFNGLRTPNRINPAPVVPNFTPQGETPRSWFARFIGWQFGTIGSILLMALLGFVLVIVAPRGVGRVASAIAVQPGLTFVFGFLTLLLGILAGGILLIACGLGLLVWLALVAAAVLGWIGVALWLGQRLLNGLKMRSASSIVEVIVGVVIITFLSRLPCIGWLFWLIFVSWGLGGVVLTRSGTRDADAPYQPTPQPAAPTAGGSGGGFAPLPESSDLAAPVVLAAASAPEATAPAPAEEAGAAVGAPVLIAISGIDAAVASRLEAAGIRTVADLAASDPVELATASGVPVGQIMVEDWIGQARRLT